MVPDINYRFCAVENFAMSEKREMGRGGVGWEYQYELFSVLFFVCMTNKSYLVLSVWGRDSWITKYDTFQ